MQITTTEGKTRHIVFGAPYFFFYDSMETISKTAVGLAGELKKRDMTVKHFGNIHPKFWNDFPVADDVIGYCDVCGCVTEDEVECGGKGEFRCKATGHFIWLFD